MNKQVNILGAGLAGSEAAYYLANHGFKVKLYEMKKIKKSSAHTSDNFAELVCSNSLKSESLTNACGLLKKEMQVIGSLILEAAYMTRVKAGQALAVDRDKFSKYITDKILNNKNIQVINQEITDVNKITGTTIIATGPLTSDLLSDNISKLVGDNKLYFYDAVAPVILTDTIDIDKAYYMDRYGEVGMGDYLNLAMSKGEYINFYNNLITAEQATRHEFDKLELFEGCMPIEEMAKRGEKTLVFGPLKPVGLNKNEKENKPHAVVQLRKENSRGTMLNMVGFQTSLKFSEQKRVFSMIPGLENAEFIRYGVMHRNTYINSPKLLNDDFSLITNNDIYFAGQISGVEGYVESAASGLMVALNILSKYNNKKIKYPLETMLGSLTKYIVSENKDFQPMNANFGIIEPLDVKIRDKKEKYSKYAIRSLEKMGELKNVINKFE